ncbi:hypothetical protein, partial [Escherichia coli]|uniref:hypothetical protein n=1 Tax=Escherichia coli TaxID=562 RepID=UPI0028DEA788
QQIAKLGNWQFDPDDELTEWSEEISKIIERDTALPKFSKEEYVSFFGEDNYSRFVDLLNKAVDEGVPFQFQCKVNV